MECPRADAAKGNAVAEWFESVLHDVLNYHSHSPKRKEHLYKLQEQLQVQKLRMVRMVATRWLSRGQTVARIFAILAAIVMEFKEDADDNLNDSASGLFKMVMMHEFMCALANFNDVLQKVNRLSQLFQKSHVVWADVKRNLASLRSSLGTAYVKGDGFVGGASWKELEESMKTTVPFGESQLYNFKGVQRLRIDSAKQQWVNDGVCDFVAKLLDGGDDDGAGLKQRFPIESETILSAFDIFNFDCYPADGASWLAVKDTFGDIEIRTLRNHYGSPRTASNGKQYQRVVNPVNVIHDWEVYREQLFEMSLLVRRKISELDSQDNAEEDKIRAEAYAELIRSDALPDVKRLNCIFCVLCLTTVWCERGFSLMAIIKTKLRNRLSITTLDSLMMIASNGVSITDHGEMEKLITEALVHWKGKCARCIARSHENKKRRGRGKRRTVPLSDLQEAQARSDARASERDGPALSESEDDDGEESATGDAASAAANDEEEEETTEQLREAVGPFVPDVGWVVQSEPADSQDAWAAMASQKVTWKGSKLAHIFDDGWTTGTYRRKYKGQVNGNSDPHWVFITIPASAITCIRCYLRSMAPQGAG